MCARTSVVSTHLRTTCTRLTPAPHPSSKAPPPTHPPPIPRSASLLPPQTALRYDVLFLEFGNCDYSHTCLILVHTPPPPSQTAPQYDVLFLDFGNRERVKGAVVRPITPALAAVPAQAYTATLAFVKVRSTRGVWQRAQRAGRARSVQPLSLLSGRVNMCSWLTRSAGRQEAGPSWG